MARTLLVTNDFPPRAGGIQNYLQALVDRLPLGEIAVYAPSWPGAPEFDAAAPYPVHRHPTSLMLPVPTVARRAARAMFGCGDDEVGDAELADAFGELANQVGGSVKGLLPGPSTLSLPTVALAGGDPAAPTGDVRLDASCDGHPVTVVVVPALPPA